MPLCLKKQTGIHAGSQSSDWRNTKTVAEIHVWRNYNDRKAIYPRGKINTWDRSVQTEEGKAGKHSRPGWHS